MWVTSSSVSYPILRLHPHSASGGGAILEGSIHMGFRLVLPQPLWLGTLTHTHHLRALRRCVKISTSIFSRGIFYRMLTIILNIRGRCCTTLLWKCQAHFQSRCQALHTYHGVLAVASQGNTACAYWHRFTYSSISDHGPYLQR